MKYLIWNIACQNWTLWWRDLNEIQRDIWSHFCTSFHRWLIASCNLSYGIWTSRELLCLTQSPNYNPWSLKTFWAMPALTWWVSRPSSRTPHQWRMTVSCIKQVRALAVITCQTVKIPERNWTAKWLQPAGSHHMQGTCHIMLYGASLWSELLNGSTTAKRARMWPV